MPSDLAKVEKLWKSNGLSLFDFQKEGCLRMLEWKKNGHGGINADEMGLGKTCQSIAVMLTLFEKGEGPFFVMAPLSVAPHWVTEVERFGCGKLEPYFYPGGNQIRRIVHSTKIKRNSVIVVPHHTFRRDFYIIRGWKAAQKCHFTSIFVDEAQYVKNYQTTIAKKLKMFDNKPTMYMLTGTPIQNDLAELYSLLCFVNPAEFNDSHEDFEAFQAAHTADTNYDALKELLKAYMIRRTKSEVFTDIPPLEEVLIYHGLSALQKGVYMDFITKNGKEMVARYGNANSTVSRMTQLRKTVVHPYLLKGVEPKPYTDGEHLITSSAKFEMLDSILKFLKKGNHKVLIFSQWVYTQVMLEDYLNVRGLKYVHICGDVSSADRVDAVEQFQGRKKNSQNDDPFIFLVTTRAGGLGLTLTEADTVIFTDSDWNPQCDEQAMARTHRIGQKKPVRVIRLIGRFTIEQVIFARAQKKLGLSNDIMANGESRTLYDMDTFDRVVSAANKIQSSTATALVEAELESLIGSTDPKTGFWVQREVNKERKVVDAQDVEVDDYLVYQGTSYRRHEEEEDLLMPPRKRKTTAYVDFSDIEEGDVGSDFKEEDAGDNEE